MDHPRLVNNRGPVLEAIRQTCPSRLRPKHSPLYLLTQALKDPARNRSTFSHALLQLDGTLGGRMAYCSQFRAKYPRRLPSAQTQENLVYDPTTAPPNYCSKQAYKTVRTQCKSEQVESAGTSSDREHLRHVRNSSPPNKTFDFTLT